MQQVEGLAIFISKLSGTGNQLTINRNSRLRPTSNQSATNIVFKTPSSSFSEEEEEEQEKTSIPLTPSPSPPPLLQLMLTQLPPHTTRNLHTLALTSHRMNILQQPISIPRIRMKKHRTPQMANL